MDLGGSGLQALLTTASIASGTRRLTLKTNPGFRVGDRIIVEVGGEAGGGLRGTKGVGGTWPAKSYADPSAMAADTSQVDGLYAWAESTGDVWRWASKSWTKTPATQYYVAKAVPRALVTTITAISGLVLTLADPAAVTATNANVHFDNAAVFNAVGAFNSGVQPPNGLLAIPAGAFAVSERLLIQSHNGWTLKGAGVENSVVFSPQGVPSANLMIAQSDGVTVRDFHLNGNARNDGFGLAYEGSSVTETNIAQGDAYPRGVIFSGCDGGLARDMKMTDVFQDAVGTSYSNNIVAERCSCVLTDGLQCYIQWMFQWSDSAGGACIDCSVDSPYLTAGFETFRSSDVTFTRPVGRNAAMSANSSGRFLIDNPRLTIEAGSQLSENSFSRSNPVININSNISPPSGSVVDGGTIRNPVIIQEGYINPAGDRLQQIVVNAHNPNITVEGGYPDNPATGGLLQAPDYMAGGLLGGGIGVVSDNAVVSVRGIRVVGSASSPDIGNIRVPAGSTVTSCVADSIVGGTQSGNQTNAKWLLTH